MGRQVIERRAVVRVYRGADKIYHCALDARPGMRTQQGVVTRTSPAGTVWVRREDGTERAIRRSDGDTPSLTLSAALRLGYLSGGG